MLCCAHEEAALGKTRFFESNQCLRMQRLISGAQAIKAGRLKLFSIFAKHQIPRSPKRKSPAALRPDREIPSAALHHVLAKTVGRISANGFPRPKPALHRARTAARRCKSRGSCFVLDLPLRVHQPILGHGVCAANDRPSSRLALRLKAHAPLAVGPTRTRAR